MLCWFNRVARVAAAEVRQVLAHRVEWLTAVVVPLIWLAVLTLAFGPGLMTQLPVGLVDADKSAASREVVEALSAIPSVQFKSFESTLEADRALRGAKIYAALTIPPDFERERRRGVGAPVVLEINKTYYAIGTILELDVKTALAAQKVANLAVRMTQKGGNFTENAKNLRVTMPEVYFLGNTGFNFVAYLLPTLIPGVMALAALLAFVSTLVREWRTGRVRGLLKTAGGSVTAAVAGKLAPWLAFWLLMSCIWVAGFAGWGGWGTAGPVILWFTAAWLLILSMAALAVLAVAVSPTWVIALSCSICLIAPTFPFTGFSFPLDSMTAGARVFGMLLPLTHFLEAQGQIWVLGSPLDAIAKKELLMCLFPAVFFTAGLLILSVRMKSWKANELAARDVPAVTAKYREELTGFWRTFALTLKKIFISRDTIAVFGAAVAFYLLFYGWPYSTQQIENVPVGVVDLDRSPASRSLISELDAASTSKIVFVVHDEAEGLDAFKRMKADTLITITHNYAEELARGRNVTVNVLGNGAYPVKTRAVQATIARIVGDTEERMNHASWMTAGVSPELLAAASRQAPDIIVKYRFNEISGYGNYTVPMVGPLIIQAVLFFGVGLSFGGWLNEKPRQRFIRDAVRNPFYGAVAVFLAFWSVALGWFLYMQGFDFSFGEYGAMQNPFAVFLVAFCFTAAVTAFAMAAATLTGNGWTAPAVVIMSAPVFFISGAVWPLENLNPFVQGFAQLIPTTPGIVASAAAAQDGAATADILPACLQLVLLTALYLTFLFWRLFAVRRNAL